MKGYDLVKLSVGIMIIEFVDLPSLILSVIISQLIFNISISFVILGSLVPSAVWLINFESKPISDPSD